MSAAVVGSESSLGLDVIYVNANVGEAAGGHTAFRLGGSVFHYQFQDSGDFILVREPWSNFRLVYNELCNRSIFISRIPLAPAIYEDLRYHFSTLLVAQQQKLHQYEESQAYLRLLQKFISGSPIMSIAGLGFFDCSRTADPQIKSLRNDIELALGKCFLRDEKKEVERKIITLTTSLSSLQKLKIFREQLALRAVLQILETGCSLAENAVIQPMTGELRLRLSEMASLQFYATKLRYSIISILSSKRPDRGTVLLLQMARCLTVKQSLVSGRMLTLDPFSDNARRQSVTKAERTAGIFRQVHDQLLGETMKRREKFCNETDYFEIAYALLEASRGRLSVLDEVLRGAESIRVEGTLKPPSHSADISLADLKFIPAQLEATAVILKSRIRLRQQQIKRDYHYNLLTRNCATELVRSLNFAFKDQVVERQALGGRLEPDADFNFTPFMLYRNVRKTFNCSVEKYLPSRRRRQLQKLYSRDKQLPVRLREGNTFTSTLYKVRFEDTPFIFFTDDGLMLRPLAGIVNLSYAAMYSAAGILTLPFAGWGYLHQGLRGMFYSLPEIFFGNIRKGTYAAAAVAASRAAP